MQKSGYLIEKMTLLFFAKDMSTADAVMTNVATNGSPSADE